MNKNNVIAVIKTGGKQYLVKPDETLLIDKINGEKGKKVVFNEVLLCQKDKLLIGKPLIKAKVEAEILGNFKDKKVRVAKFKAKSRYRRVTGHRKIQTKVKILKIIA